MAISRAIGGNGELFIGEDKTLRFTVLEDVAGADLLFDVRTHDDAPTFVLQKVPTTEGQRIVIVELSAADTRKFRPQVYRYSLKLENEDAETILYWGDLVVQKATVA